ncbi:MAG: hypothetical protein AAB434_03900 [Planctomycetota bacterium]
MRLLALLIATAAIGCRTVPPGGVHPLEEPMEDDEVDSARAEGERLWEIDPRTLINVESSLEWWRRIARSFPDDYEACWKGARAAAWIAGRARGDEERKRFAMEGIQLGNSAVEAKADGAEGRYCRALAMGELADVDHSYGVDAVKKMEEDCLAAAAADERFDHAAGHRFVGILYVECPGPPTSIGSLRKAKQHLDQALNLAPDWPPNRFWSGKLAREEGDLDRARREFQAVIDAPTPPGFTTEAEEWRDDAREELAK